MRRTRTYLGLGIILVLMLSACAAGPNELVDTGPDPAGFWLGLWQGFISPITFLISCSLPKSISTRSRITATGTTSASWWEWPPPSVGEQAAVAHQLVGFAVGGERPAARPGSSASTSGSGGSTFQGRLRVRLF